MHTPLQQSVQPFDVRFVGGTLEIHDTPTIRSAALPACCIWDGRTQCYRAPASEYARIILSLIQHKIPYVDHARRYQNLQHTLQIHRTPRPYQVEARDAWIKAGKRGLVVLPTGAGKSYLALMCADVVRRDTLVIAPTLNLVHQWFELLRSNFRCDIGVIGGGEYRICPITVSTYDSAYLHMEHLGSRFGLVIFDECHHLPSEAYALAAQSCLAPYRLGLTATPERPDERHSQYPALIGPLVYRTDIQSLSGDYLADFSIERIAVSLTDEERFEYDEARDIYRQFVRSQGIRMNTPQGWSEFVMRAARSTEGRQAMRAFQRQKQIALAAPSKLAYVEALLHRHVNDRVLLFTENNSTAYELARQCLLPVITHQTKVTERSTILQYFAEGKYTALVSSKVLNEGVDMPDANVAILISGNSSTREFTQRLGRILRKKEGKKAILYELISSDTTEKFISQRRGASFAHQ